MAPGRLPLLVWITNDQSPITNKVIKNGQLLIERGDELFNAQGARVK